METREQEVEVHLPSSCAHGILSPSCVGSFLPSYCSCATCSPCCCPRGSCWCWCSSFAYSSPYSRWQFNSLSTNGRKLLADNASRLLAYLLAWSIIVHLLMHLSVPPPPFTSLQVARLIELSCSLYALAFLLFLPSESWLGFITFMQFMACQCALCSSASCCPGPHTPVQSSLYSQPACCARTAQGGPGCGKILLG